MNVTKWSHWGFALTLSGVGFGCVHTDPVVQADEAPSAAAAASAGGVGSARTLAPDLPPVMKGVAGTWDVQETIAAGPMGPGGTGKGVITAVAGPGGKSIIMDYTTVEGPMKGFELHEILTYDAAREVYVMAYVDGFRGVVVAQEGKEVDGHLEFRREMSRGDQTLVSDGHMGLSADGQLVLDSFMGPNPDSMTRTLHLVGTRRE